MQRLCYAVTGLNIYYWKRIRVEKPKKEHLEIIKNFSGWLPIEFFINDILQINKIDATNWKHFKFD